MTGRVRDRTIAAIRQSLNWLFRDRVSGRVVIAQFPNIPLLAWLAATVASRFVHGRAHTVVGVFGTIALAGWAGDEIVRGVNPWRRMLGAVVLGAVVVGWSVAA